MLLLARLRTVFAVFLICLALSGCVRYDVGVKFDSPSGGQIVQHVKLGDRLSALSSRTAQDWLDDIDQRTRALQGKVQRPSPMELVATLPFTTGKDFAEKFDQLFASTTNNAIAGSPTTTQPTTRDEPTQPSGAQPSGTRPAPMAAPSSTNTHLTLRQSNWLLAVRHRLSLDVDLRSLGMVSSDGNVVVNPGSLLDLNFALEMPHVRNVGAAVPQLDALGRPTWKLVPGELNHIEAVFWLPSPLGVGTVGVAIAVGLGGYFKTRSQSRPL